MSKTLILPIGGGGIQPTGTLNITKNGVKAVAEYANVDVNVPASAVCHGTKYISSNGIYGVTGYEEVSIKVPQTQDDGTLRTTLQSNGTTTINVDGYKFHEITVDVSGGGGGGQIANVCDTTVIHAIQFASPASNYIDLPDGSATRVYAPGYGYKRYIVFDFTSNTIVFNEATDTIAEATIKSDMWSYIDSHYDARGSVLNGSFATPPYGFDGVKVGACVYVAEGKTDCGGDPFCECATYGIGCGDFPMH